jgi:hypothetical protein
MKTKDTGMKRIRNGKNSGWERIRDRKFLDQDDKIKTGTERIHTARRGSCTVLFASVCNDLANRAVSRRWDLFTVRT